MPNHRSRGVLAVSGTVLLLALVTTGCGRRGLPAAAGVDGAVASPIAATSEPMKPSPAETTAAETAAETAAATRPPTAIEPPAATETSNPGPPPTSAPLEAPDLTAIERLLADLDDALGADATAATDEGSPR